ncbi:conserved hypothetical protein [Culex quinquefasciatus]|uniref:Adenylate cyclase n=1 Tax=Culex quinquefasciatus TaxID=7176 RepID=B0WHW7_CULQU|nr:conserved hypothetical protein [Culex quinquefasciatus]|eukprot:XP_001848301.1 conserved hypothetical protein [Culex quinquefasciatus]
MKKYVACATKLGVDLAVCEFFPQLEDNNLCDDVATEEMTNTSSTQMLSAIANFTTDSDPHFSKTVCSAKEKSINEVAFLNSYRSIIILILCATFMREISLEVTGILPNLLTSLSGGTPLVVTGMYSYLTVCTSEKNRTFRFACAAVVIATIPIGANFFSGFLFKSLGFVKLCLLCIVTDSIGLMYGLFVLKEPTEISDNSAVQEKESRPNQNGGTSNESWRKLFDFTLVIDCIQVLTRKRNFNLRLIVILTVVVYFINYGSLGDAESAAILAYLRFNWITNLGTWISYDLATTLLGTLLAMGVLSKRFGVSDFLICVFSVCFTLVGKPIMAYAVSAVKPHLYYVATSIDVFEGSKTVAIRSIVSKLVEQHEIVRTFTVYECGDSLIGTNADDCMLHGHWKQSTQHIGTTGTTVSHEKLNRESFDLIVLQQ